MVETIYQVIQLSGAQGQKKRVLAVAPSNTAADEMCLRLKKLGVAPGVMRRVNWHQRASNTQRPDLLPYSLMDDKGLFKIPTAEELSGCQVIVATCFTAGALAFAGLPPVDLLVLDEAAQPTEPESRVALMLAGQETTVVLCGDPKQLGPVVRSQSAAMCGLRVSLMERLMQDPLYSEEHPGRIIKLVNNYRSHESILALSSHLFYNGELRACADVYETGLLAVWERLPTQQFPLLFFGVDGVCKPSLDGASFFNLAEATQTASIIKELLETNLEVSPSDFGIMAPYRKQVLILRDVLRSRGLGRVDVGTVDDFQGKERRIIIISTVITKDMRLPVSAWGQILPKEEVMGTHWCRLAMTHAIHDDYLLFSS
jgi:superfamily I DNA and/or RNA helicase